MIEQPESLTADRILGEGNAEVRRVMLERAGYETVLDRAELLHEDVTGKLWRLELPGDEPLMLSDVTDPSTGRRYFLRVDPGAYGGLREARAAIASTWRYQDGTLVFSTPDGYVLAAEA